MRLLASILAVLLAFAPLAAGASAPADNAAFVTAAYQLVLGRPADAAATAFTNQLNAGSITRDQLVAALMNSHEFRSLEVAALYARLLHRPADSAGSNQLIGLLDQGQTSSAIAAQLLGSQEYFTLSGNSNAGFLARVYQDILGRPVDAPAAQAWNVQFAEGVSRQQVAHAILTSTEGNAGFLTLLYNNVLHRPGAPTGSTLLQAAQAILNATPAPIRRRT
jgi:hypothetical protein